MSGTGVVEFIKQVRQETLKVTWSSRKETITTTIIVLVMIAISSLFFLLADGIIFWFTQLVMGL
jgi:preprotein translocase subunit SecE